MQKRRYRKPEARRHAVHTRKQKVLFMTRGSVADTERIVRRLREARLKKRRNREALAERTAPWEKTFEKTLLLADAERLQAMEALARHARRGREKWERRMAKKKQGQANKK